MTNHRFYVNHPDQWAFIEDFSVMMLRMADVTFYQPSPVIAPWHWQALVNGTVFNFWPHRNKWSVEGERARYGFRDAEKYMRQVEESQDDPLIEDD